MDTNHDSIQCRAEEKRIDMLANMITTALDGLDTDSKLDGLTIAQIKRVLRTADLLAAAVLHKDTVVTVTSA